MYSRKRKASVFGRRGSGKSSLLQKIAADLTVDRTPIAFVDLETFKQHSYPDVLLSVLIKSFVEVKRWLDTAATNPANKTSFWEKLFGTAPTKPGFNRAATKALSDDFGKMIGELNAFLLSADESKIKESAKDESGTETKAALSAKLPNSGIGGDLSTSTSGKSSNETQNEYTNKKIEALHRNIMRYQDLFGRLSQLAGGRPFFYWMIFTTYG